MWDAVPFNSSVLTRATNPSLRAFVSKSLRISYFHAFDSSQREARIPSVSSTPATDFSSVQSVTIPPDSASPSSAPSIYLAACAPLVTQSSLRDIMSQQRQAQHPSQSPPHHRCRITCLRILLDSLLLLSCVLLHSLHQMQCWRTINATKNSILAAVLSTTWLEKEFSCCV